MPVSLGLSVVGLGLAIYLTIEHFTSPGSLACPANASLDCNRVTTSDSAYFLGVPVALLGALYFVVAVVACLPQAWARTEPWVVRGRLALTGVGVLFVLYLIYAELFEVGAICLWCTAVHAISIALFGVVVLAVAGQDPTLR
jgi:uncharacterized membrane protein